MAKKRDRIKSELYVIFEKVEYTIMHIIVTVKPVPNFNTPVYYLKNLSVDRLRTEMVLNPDDLKAMRLAKALRSVYGGSVTAISMAPESARGLLRKLFAYGADTVIHITDPSFVGSDSYATSYILSKAIALLPKAEMVISGARSMDGETGQVAPSMAEWLGYPHLCRLTEMPEVHEEAIHYTQQNGNAYNDLYCRLPVVLTVGDGLDNKGEIPLMSINELYCKTNRTVDVLHAAALGLVDREFGRNFSKTRVVGSKISQTAYRQRKQEQVQDSSALWRKMIGKEE